MNLGSDDHAVLPWLCMGAWRISRLCSATPVSLVAAMAAQSKSARKARPISLNDRTIDQIDDP
jgi:hypothetical protein